MFDAETLREELAALEQKLQHRNDPEMVNRYVVYARKLRRMEYEQDGYVSARNNVTGY